MITRTQLEDFGQKFKFLDGEVRGKGRSRDFDKYLKERYLALEPDVTLKEFRREVKEYLEESTSDIEGCLDIDKAVDDFIRDKKIRISEDGKEIGIGMVDLVPGDIKEHMKAWCHRKNVGLSKEDKLFRHEPLFAVFYEHIQHRGIQYWEDIKTNLRHRPHPGLPTMLAEVLHALRVSDRDKQRFNADRLMLAHWIWTVKRRVILQDPQPALQFMIVFHGRQGGGKTSLVENHLCSVFGNKVISTDLSVIHDGGKEFKKWTENAVVNFDELSMRGLHDGKRTRTPELLKQLITSGRTHERMYHTQTQQSFAIRATFCGSSNKPLAEFISDPTGMRRYWEINCNTTAENPEFDWDVLENFDWQTLWQAVDENLEFGYVQTHHKMYPLISEIQDSYCVQPQLRRWFEETYEVYWDKELVGKTATDINRNSELLEDGVRVVSAMGLYGEYTEGMADISSYAVSQSQFMGCMDRLGVRTLPHSKSRPGTKAYVVRKAQ